MQTNLLVRPNIPLNERASIMICRYLSDAKSCDHDYCYDRAARRAFLAECWHKNARNHQRMFKEIYVEFLRDLEQDLDTEVMMMFANPALDHEESSSEAYIFHLQSLAVLPQKPELIDTLDWARITKSCIKSLFSCKLLGGYPSSEIAIKDLGEQLTAAKFLANSWADDEDE